MSPRARIVIVVVYFGDLPPYFDLWLRSCGENPGFHWVVYTDAKFSGRKAPGNVSFRATTLQAVLETFSAELGFAARADSPYKLCDFRPLYWTLLQQDGENFDFWGHCDLDVIFGDLQKFISPDILEQHDKVFSVGHLTLYRNCETANQMFRREHPEVDWRAILRDPRHRGFDEHLGVNRIWRAQGGRVFEREGWVADIDPAVERFELVASGRNYRRQLFFSDRGLLFRGYESGGRWRSDEFMYIHFQKRRMLCMTATEMVRFAIAPGGFFDLGDEPMGVAVADRLNPSRFDFRETIHRKRAQLRALRRRYGVGPAPPPLR